MSRRTRRVVVSAATAADLDGIESLDGLAGSTRRLLHVDLAPEAPRHVHVATDARTSAIVGVAIATDQDDAAHLLDLVVEPSHRRCGVASSLVATLARALLLAGTPALTLEVRVGNGAARSLYAALGLDDVGTRPGYYQDGEDARILWHRDMGALARVDQRGGASPGAESPLDDR